MLFNFNLRQISSKSLKRDLLFYPLKKRTKPQQLVVFIPWNFFVNLTRCTTFEVYNVFLFNTIFYSLFYLPSNFSKVSFNKETNSICYKSLYCSNYTKPYLNHISQVAFTFSKVYFSKVKFKGKGYYIYKNVRNTIAPQFGYSHRLYVYSWFSYIKFTSKSSLIVFGLCLKSIFQVAQSIRYLRKINVFTGRGVRFSRQVVYSKPGKVSSYR